MRGSIRCEVNIDRWNGRSHARPGERLLAAAPPGRIVQSSPGAVPRYKTNIEPETYRRYECHIFLC